jgi:hypothetical protein
MVSEAPAALAVINIVEAPAMAKPRAAFLNRFIYGSQ